MFNTLKYVKKLEEAGVSREQAEIHLQIVTDFMEQNFATQQNVKDLSADLKGEMSILAKDLRSEMAALTQELRHEMHLLEQRLVIKLGTIVSVAIGVAVALTKLVN